MCFFSLKFACEFCPECFSHYSLTARTVVVKSKRVSVVFFCGLFSIDFWPGLYITSFDFPFLDGSFC